jgi:hypothetical protein
MLPLLREKPLDYRERKRRMREILCCCRKNGRITSVKPPIYSIRRSHIPREKEKMHEWLNLESKCMRRNKKGSVREVLVWVMRWTSMREENMCTREGEWALEEEKRE